MQQADMDNVVMLAQHGFASTVIDNQGGGIYNNGRVAIAKDLIFGLSVWDGEQWFPIKGLHVDDVSHVRQLVGNDPLFQWGKELLDIAIYAQQCESSSDELFL